MGEGAVLSTGPDKKIIPGQLVSFDIDDIEIHDVKSYQNFIYGQIVKQKYLQCE